MLNMHIAEQNIFNFTDSVFCLLSHIHFTVSAMIIKQEEKIMQLEYRLLLLL